ncbi:MAG: hypothetical protein P8X74_04025 [Reinekea sp.]
MLKIYGIKNCDTIKKTLKWFDSQQASYEFVDYKKQPPNETLVTQFLNSHDWDTVVINVAPPGASWMSKPKHQWMPKMH